MKIEIKIVDDQEFKPVFDQYHRDVFAENHSFNLWSILSQEELDSADRLRKNMGDPFKLRLLAYDENQNILGWSWGFQESTTVFYMCNSAVLPQYRKQGVYTALMKKCLEILKNEGFQMAYSRHTATNNAVIIPKLKAGFIISKMEIEDKFGVVIHLHYYFNKLRRKIMDYRAGQLSPDEEIKKILFT